VDSPAVRAREICAAGALDRKPCALSALGVAAAVWGLAGVVALLVRAVSRLWPPAIDALAAPLDAAAWAFAAGSVLFIGFFEGYRGFQRGFAPRVVARAWHLARAPRPLHALLAPLFCMGLIHATRRRLITSWTVLSLIVGAVLALRLVAQPWRGLVDLGVVVGLVWGLAAIVAFAGRALAGGGPPGPADLPA
jgi:hypothetical protein